MSKLESRSFRLSGLAVAVFALSFNEFATAAVYVLGDAGSAFSPHGIGPEVGLKLENLTIGVGTGDSKNGVAGRPFYAGFRVLQPSQKANLTWQWGAGLTGYKGSGERVVVFSENSPNFTYETEATWTFLYMSVAFGGVYQNFFSPNIFLPFETGFSSIVYSKVTANLSGTDGSNLGNPIGLDTGGYYDYGSMGPQDYGFYVRVGLGWWI